MQILLTTDNHITGTKDLTTFVEGVVEGTLGRFGDRMTRVEVHLSDESSAAKSSDSDKRCVMEARMAGLQPVAVRHHGATLGQALEGAAEKLEKTLDRKLDRLDDPKGRTSFSGDPTVATDETR
jgi:ribosome-associated translation inhibitor RaiA